MSAKKRAAAAPSTWRERWYEIIFEADTRAGKWFDVGLLIAILLSVLVVMLESVREVRQDHALLLERAEYFFTALFTVEYVVRILCAPRPWRYVFSFYGIVDLLAILPTYFLFLFPHVGVQRLAVVRALRLLRAFRIFKLASMLSEATSLRAAIWASRAKIAVFLSVVLISVVIVGAAMHLVEGPDDEAEADAANGFESIPASMYWTIVTMTTVGYGDVSPQTPIGKILAAGMMILGYSLIIVPTGIVSAEMAQASFRLITTQVCPHCMAEGHDADATFCKFCGEAL